MTLPAKSIHRKIDSLRQVGDRPNRLAFHPTGLLARFSEFTLMSLALTKHWRISCLFRLIRWQTQSPEEPESGTVAGVLVTGGSRVTQSTACEYLTGPWSGKIDTLR